MQTFKHIFRAEQETLKSKAKEMYGFDAFYAWFIAKYGDQMTEYEQENMSRNIPALKSLFEQSSEWHKKYHQRHE